jgi:hypothetical protein
MLQAFVHPEPDNHLSESVSTQYKYVYFFTCSIEKYWNILNFTILVPSSQLCVHVGMYNPCMRAYLLVGMLLDDNVLLQQP